MPTSKTLLAAALWSLLMTAPIPGWAADTVSVGHLVVPEENTPAANPMAWRYRQAQDSGLGQSEKAALIKTLSQQLLDIYVDPAVADKVQLALHTKLTNGEYGAVSIRADFSTMLTLDLQRVSGDMHLRVMLDPLQSKSAELPVSPEQPGKIDSGIGEVKRLPGNIGYIEFLKFAPLQRTDKALATAMSALADSSVLIIDLRRNGGGDPAAVSYVTSYLFTKRTHLNDFRWRQGNRVDEFWTSTQVPGKRFGARKPVFVLTSNVTFSAAEEFAYNLQQLRRATLIGERTGGGANPGADRRLSDHFTAFIPTGRAVNPVSKTNWEGTGVAPHIDVPAAEALLEAQRSALKILIAAKAEGPGRRELQLRLKELQTERARSSTWYAQQALFVRGTMNGWGTSVAMARDGASRYTANVAFSTGQHQLKIASEDFVAVDLGTPRRRQDIAVAGSNPLMEDGENARLEISEAGTYQLTLDIADPYRPSLRIVKLSSSPQVD